MSLLTMALDHIFPIISRYLNLLGVSFTTTHFRFHRPRGDCRPLLWPHFQFHSDPLIGFSSYDPNKQIDQYTFIYCRQQQQCYLLYTYCTLGNRSRPHLDRLSRLYFSRRGKNRKSRSFESIIEYTRLYAYRWKLHIYILNFWRMPLRRLVNTYTALLFSLYVYSNAGEPCSALICEEPTISHLSSVIVCSNVIYNMLIYVRALQKFFFSFAVKLLILAPSAPLLNII